MQSESVTAPVLACERLATLANSITVELVMTSASALRSVTFDYRLGEVPYGPALVRDSSGEIVGILFPDETMHMNPSGPSRRDG